MILELAKATDPILRTPAQKFDFANPPLDPIELSHNLAQTMVNKIGVGLAANQVGLPWSVFVMGCGGGEVYCCYNPRIVNMSTERVEMEEGCLSFPGLHLKIKRPIAIRVRYQQPNGEVVTKDFSGLTSRIFQHEYDHLQGKVFTEYMTRLELDIAKRKAKKLLKQKG